MFNGDQSRKKTLVEYGFRLPSAMDNRPLNFAEFEERIGQTIYVSATPGPYELTKTGGEVIEQIIRPTGLTDPVVVVRPVKGQIDDLLEECRLRAERNERVLVTTLTKKMSEDLTEYFAEVNVRVRYLHSDIETLERIKILRDLRRGEFDVLVGINLLREGLDLPEVSLVAILDADKEGFLRSESSLIQTMGRAARNANGTAILYADKITDSMKRAIGETERRAPSSRSTTASTASRRRPSSSQSSPRWSRPTRPTTSKSRSNSKPLKSIRRQTSTRPSRASKPRCATPPRASNSSAPPSCATASSTCARASFKWDEREMMSAQ